MKFIETVVTAQVFSDEERQVSVPSTVGFAMSASRRSNSVGSPNGRAMKSTPTGSFAGIGPTSLVSFPARSRSHTFVVNPAGTVMTGKPC